MIQINNLKALIVSSFGVVGGAVLNLLGGWDMALRTLIIFMVVDYVTGLMVAGVFRKSKKTDSGALSSLAGWKGLCRKGTTLLIVMVAAQLDVMTGSQYIRSAVVIAYAANEAISIIENATLMGLPVPDVVRKGIDLLTNKEEKPKETEGA